MSDDKRHLHYLHELSKYKVDDEDPDVRGWTVVDADGRNVGKVDNFLVSKEARRVRYLDVEIDNNIIGDQHKPLDTGKTGGTHEFVTREGENHVIIPIGMARLDREHNNVVTDKINSSTFDDTRRIEKNKPVNPEYEVYVVEHFTGSDTGYQNKTTDNRFYERDAFSYKNYRGV